MGYEIKLLIGHATKPSPEFKDSKVGQIDGEGENAYVYYPALKDKKGNFIPTGRKESTFLICAEVDMCKMGMGPFSTLVEKSKNKDKKLVYRWFEGGNTTLTEDCYGDKFKPVPIKLVIEALEAEQKKEALEGDYRYRRTAWALALLKSISETSGEEFTVLFYGH